MKSVRIVRTRLDPFLFFAFVDIYNVDGALLLLLSFMK